jgi:hypothetical protein
VTAPLSEDRKFGMLDKKAIIDNALMKEIISIRIDTLWKMIELKTKNRLPEIDEEGATGKFDNKGAIFIPGGLVYRDVDEQRVRYETFKKIRGRQFRDRIKSTMRFDNATLLYPDGLAPSINLDSGFFSRCARQILTFKRAAYRRKKSISRKIANEVRSDDIIRSNCPPYIKPPYGARTRISTCISIGLVDPPMFFSYCKAQYNLSDDQANRFAQNLDLSIEPAAAKSGGILYPPYVIVCHDTRYKENNYTGLTRILGLGKFGEFATLTIEETNKPLTDELKRKRQEFKAEDLCAEYAGSSFVLILRIYAPTNPGKRSRKHLLHVISPRKDLGLDTDRIEKEARKRYQISN